MVHEGLRLPFVRQVVKHNGATLTNQYLYNLSGAMITELDGSGNWTRGEIYAGKVYIGAYDNGTTTFALSALMTTIKT